MERGERWRSDVVFSHSAISESLQKEKYNAVVIAGEDLVSLAHRAIHYFDRIPLGPKKVILAFHSRPLDPAHLYRLWCFLKARNRLNLFKNLAYLNTLRSNRKFLPVIHDKQGFNPKVPIWDVALNELTSDHIRHLFVRGIEESERIDYKGSGCLSSKSDMRELLKDFAAMANASGGIIIVGIREENGQPIQPMRTGLQSVRSVDQQINRLYQFLFANFGETAPKVEIRSLEVLSKRLLLVKIFKGAQLVGGKRKPDGWIEYPVRTGRITTWHSPK